MEAINRGVGKHKGFFFYFLRPLQASAFQSTACILLLALPKTILVPSTQPEAAQLPPWALLLPLPYQCYAWPSHLISIQGFVFCMAEMMHFPWHRPQGRCTCPSWSQMAISLLFTFPSCCPRCCKITPKPPRSCARNCNVRPESREHAWVDGEMLRTRWSYLF